MREVTQRGDIPWSFRPSDTPAYQFTSLQQAWRLPNGNTVINNWINEWTKTPENEPGSVQAIEITPAKQVVWVLQSWSSPVDLGPATTIQFLGVGPALEDAHFGPIH